VEAHAEVQQRIEQWLEVVIETQQRIEQRLQKLVRTQDQMAGQLGQLRDEFVELRYREHVGGYFGRLLRRARVVRADELDDLIDHGLTTGVLDEETAHDLRLADLIVRGRRPGERDETYLVVEVSAGLDRDDVLRAARRAAVLRRLRPALAVVAGDGLTPEAAEVAGAAGVWQVLDGRAEAPRSGT